MQFFVGSMHIKFALIKNTFGRSEREEIEIRKSPLMQLRLRLFFLHETWGSKSVSILPEILNFLEKKSMKVNF